MHIDLVGTGMEGSATLTAEAALAIRKAELLIGAQRMLDAVPEDGRKRICSYDAQKIADLISCEPVSRAAILLSGDVGFFSGAKRLMQTLQGHDILLIPGISSVPYFCAKIAVSWEDLCIVSLHGQDSSIAVHVLTNERTFFLLGGLVTASQVCDRLCAFGLGTVRVSIGSRLGYPDEQIFTGTAQELTTVKCSRLSVMIVENPLYLGYLPCCIPDAEFIREHVPMTKAEIRGISVSALNIGKNSICWDIGCGTGSVSVEMALRCPRGHVYALDKNPAAIALSRENMRRFSCDNITVIEAAAPEGLENFPVPDCVFLGGSNGEMESIFGMIFKKNPSARIAVTAVTLETLHTAQSTFRKFGGTCQITQISVTQTREVGSYTMLQAQNPVFLLQGSLQCGA